MGVVIDFKYGSDKGDGVLIKLGCIWGSVVEIYQKWMGEAFLDIGYLRFVRVQVYF